MRTACRRFGLGPSCWLAVVFAAALGFAPWVYGQEAAPAALEVPPWGGLDYAERVLAEAAEAEHVVVASFGTSAEGRDLWSVRMSHTPEGGRVPVGHRKVLLIGLQHGDEPAGGAALLDMIADLSADPDRLPHALELWVVPVLNPDGAERDQRRNANGFDLNRDHVILSQPETRALHALARSIRPHVVVDCHEFNRTSGDYAERGWFEWPEIMLGACSHPMIPAAIRERGQGFVRGGMTAGAGPRFPEPDGGDFHYSRYLVGAAPGVLGGELRPSTLDADDARNGLALATGGVGLIIESGIRRSAQDPHADLPRRVAAYRSLLSSILHAPIDPAVFDLHEPAFSPRGIPRAIPTDFFWVMRDPVLTPVKVIEAETGAVREVASARVMDVVAIKSAAPLPIGYAVSGERAEAVGLARGLLEAHGLGFVELREAAEVDAERVELVRIEEDYDPQYHRYAGRQITSRRAAESMVLPAGSLVVRLDALPPRDARRAAALLEPCMKFGLFQWPAWRATVADDAVLPFLRLTTPRGLPGLDAPGFNPFATSRAASAGFAP
ncbi:MAG: M14 family zinc carboxypeptidase [Planctomycetota bacterium]